jgi:hypothetical protein
LLKCWRSVDFWREEWVCFLLKVLADHISLVIHGMISTQRTH